MMNREKHANVKGFPFKEPSIIASVYFSLHTTEALRSSACKCRMSVLRKYLHDLRVCFLFLKGSVGTRRPVSATSIRVLLLSIAKMILLEVVPGMIRGRSFAFSFTFR